MDESNLIFCIGNAKVCSTSGCLSAGICNIDNVLFRRTFFKNLTFLANLIKGNIDETQYPCHDFYKFACGGFINNSVIPANRQSIDHLDSVKEKVLTDIREIVRKKINPKEQRIFKMVKNYFRACEKESKSRL